MTDAPQEPPPRRIDITIRRVCSTIEGLDDAERGSLASQPWWPHLEILMAVRAMERGEEIYNRERGHAEMTYALAEAYDRLVTPGEHPLEALLRVFRAVYGQGNAQSATK